MEQNIKKLICTGNFLEAKKLLHHLDKERLNNILYEIGHDENSISAYAFVCFLIHEHETAENQFLASELLINTYAYINSYASALHHLRRAIELDQNDIELEEMLIFFHFVPEELVSRDEAIKVAKKVLEKKPDSIPAQRVLIGKI